MLTINIDVPSAPPEPYFVQLFKISTFENVAAKLEPVLIYEGNPGTVQHLLMSDESEAVFKARVVGPGGVCSEFVIDETGYNGTNYNTLPENTTIMTFPIKATISALKDTEVINWMLDLRVPDKSIKRAIFLSKGSYGDANDIEYTSFGISIGPLAGDRTVYVDLTDNLIYDGGAPATSTQYNRDYDTGELTDLTIWSLDTQLTCNSVVEISTNATTIYLQGILILHLGS
jgi:hypothetical protein